MKNYWFPSSSCLPKCLGCVLCCNLCTFLVLYFVLFHLHEYTCDYGYVLCTPLHQTLQLLDYLPKDEIPDASEYRTAAPRTLEQCVAAGYVNSSLVNPCPDDFELAIVIAQQHGGTKLVTKTLGTHSHIEAGLEEVQRYWHQHCTQFSFIFEPNSECNWQTYQRALHQITERYLQQHTNRKTGRLRFCSNENIPENSDSFSLGRIRKDKETKGKKAKHVWLWKLQIQQVFPSWYRNLADYLYCNNITVVHLIRQSTVSSLWSSHALVNEAFVEAKARIGVDDSWSVKHMIEHKRVDKEHRVNQAPLDPTVAEKYVRELDANREQLTRAIRMQEFGVKYLTVLFEDLINAKHALYYWEALESFLGVAHELVDWSKGQMSRSVQRVVAPREHSKRCRERISNWPTVKKQLNGTLSYDACEKYNS